MVEKILKLRKDDSREKRYERKGARWRSRQNKKIYEIDLEVEYPCRNPTIGAKRSESVCFGFELFTYTVRGMIKYNARLSVTVTFT